MFRWNALAAFALGLAGLATQPAAAQQSYYADQPSFQIPIIPDPSDRRTSAILLHVSEDYGKTYQYVATASPSQRGVPFKAPRDGWYWFAVQTQDNMGQLNPQTMVGAQPALKVCVDTQAPNILLKQGPSNKDGTQSVEWEIRDDNLDLPTFRLEYRPQGARDWVPLPAQQVQAGSHVFNPGITSPVEVRLTVRDKARNVGEQIVSGNGRSGTSGGTGQVIMVRSKRFQLNYKIDDVGPSDVAKVEVYYTRDNGRSWRKYEADAPKEPPCILEVPEEGRYGFTLIARSGVDLGEQPPRPGDAPHIVVEVDETKPIVKILSAEVGRGADQGLMTLTWTASDKFLGNNPISISFARDSNGPWTQALKDLPNTGRHVWKLPAEGLPFQFFLRVECADQAGNIGVSASASPIKVDLNLPKARVVGVEVAPASPGGSVAPAPTGSIPMAPAGAIPSPPASALPMAPATPSAPMGMGLPPAGAPLPPTGLPSAPAPTGSGLPAAPATGLPPMPMGLPATPAAPANMGLPPLPPAPAPAP